MKNEIDADYPFHMIVTGHYKYGCHSVLGVGYVQYKYNKLLISDYSRYVRIADGWLSTGRYPNRYVHTTVGLDDIDIYKIRQN